MGVIELNGCAPSPFGSYLKALGVFRLVSEQEDAMARGSWGGGVFRLVTALSERELVDFFLMRYAPTPILAPWNGGSGFYEKDRRVGIDAIAGSNDPRFSRFRAAIETLRGLPEITEGKREKAEEDERRTRILREARNRLPDPAVEWIDAAIGITADGGRSFAPVLGTGGNEGRLDYTNNFMERLAGLLIASDKTPVRELLESALFNTQTAALQPAAAGQFDPARAGGANQGEGVSTPDVPVNPWDFVLTLEGAVAWAAGIYRRQGVRYGSVLCSPFTVRSSTIGYGSASAEDSARAEVWMPLWKRPALYGEVKVLLREGRASVDAKRHARNGLEFAEAASSLGVDRGIAGFMRYNLLKRRGDSYIALPAGYFEVSYRSVSDRIRELDVYLSDLRGLPDILKDSRRAIEAAMFEALLRDDPKRLRDVMTAFGRLVRRVALTGKDIYLPVKLIAQEWLEALPDEAEVRIAAAIGSMYHGDVGPIRANLFAACKAFAWTGVDLASRMLSVAERRVQSANATEAQENPFGGSYELDPGDATLFIEGSVNDSVIEDLVFAFALMNWQGFKREAPREADSLPVYAVLKHVFLPKKVNVRGEGRRIAADGRILGLLRGGRTQEAVDIAKLRLRVAGLNPIEAKYEGGVDPVRLGAALLIPVRAGKRLSAAVLHQQEAATA